MLYILHYKLANLALNTLMLKLVQTKPAIEDPHVLSEMERKFESLYPVTFWYEYTSGLWTLVKGLFAVV